MPILGESAESAGTETREQDIVADPRGEQPTVEVRSAIADTFAGRVHIEWDATAPVTPFGQLPFFIDYLKQAGLFDAWVADCPLSTTEAFPWDAAPRYLIRDRDTGYGVAVTRRLRAMGIRDRPIAPRSPWQNSHVEWLIGSIRRECLDHVVVLGERHLRELLANYSTYHPQ